MPVHAPEPAAVPAPSAFAFPDEASELLRSCVHCGLCLGACPTYRENGNENDSPRGRLYLMKGLADGRLQPTGAVAGHLDLCLDCRACETACPSGVHYGRILESTREELLRARPPGGVGRFLRALFFKQLFPHHERLALLVKALGLLQRSGLRDFLRRSGAVEHLPQRLRDLEAMQPDLAEPPFREHAPAVFPAFGGPPRLRVAFFSGCVMDLVMGGIHRATVKALQAHGCEVLSVPGQACCGALMFHAGEAEAGRSLARRNLQMFEGLGVDAIVNNSAGCGSTLKEYAELLPGDSRAKEFSARVRDVSELLAGLEPVAPLRPVPLTACYDAPCHLLHGQKISAQPLAVLRRIPELKLVELPDADFCCGAAGIYNLTQPEMSWKILARKVEALKQTGAQTVLTGNPGCILQLRQGCREAGLACDVRHPMELLARAVVDPSGA
ncbi:MAG: heterodisulfide reductase-related iron-sulfur binding cluster [Planctomycetota bacterium]|nr:heterodisulfide reductase-related iron-sulfur binding cluster [Planctomycetota bacterium]